MARVDDKMGMTDTGSATLSPWTAIGVGWLLCALLAVLAGKTLHAEAALPAGQQSSWAVVATGWLDRAFSASGAGVLVARTAELRERTYGAHLQIGTRTAPIVAAADDGLAAVIPAGDDDSAAGDDDSAEGTVDVAEPVEPVAPGKPAPSRILIAGASSIQFELGHALESALEQFEGVTIHRYGQHSTGLSRPDYFDWVAHGAKLRDEFEPDLVIAQFGGNDCQGMTDLNGRAIGAYGSDAWDAAYYDRVRAFVELFRHNGIPLVMMGMPIMKESGFRKRIAHLGDEVVVAAVGAGDAVAGREAVAGADADRLLADRDVEHAAQEDGALVQFLSVHDLTAAADGSYMEIAEVRGRRRIIRATDGAHLTRDGADLVVGQIVEILSHSFTFELPDQVATAAAPADGAGGG